MRVNTGVSEGFKPNLNYSRIDGDTGRKANWKRTKISNEGTVAITALGIYGDELCGVSVEITRRFKDGGASVGKLWSFLETRLPWVKDWYREQTGEELDPETWWHRYHKMWYSNKAKDRHLRGTRSDEHYMNHARLRPLVPAVERMVRLNTRITREDAIAILRGE